MAQVVGHLPNRHEALILIPVLLPSKKVINPNFYYALRREWFIFL
jgi:hypothetical protein